MEPTIEHKIYKRAASIQEADAVARAFKDYSMKSFDYPFKFPELRAQEVRARILHTGICHSDCHHVSGEWGSDMQWPIAPGHEIVAQVMLVGADVKDFKTGDIIGCGPMRAFCGKCNVCKKGKENLCSSQPADDAKFLYDPFFGGFATHIQVTHQACFHMPAKLDIKLAPPLMCAGITCFAPLIRHGFKGCKVGVIGIGGLGHLGVKFAHALGYHVTGFTTRPVEKLEELKKMGAEGAVSSIDLAELAKHAGQFDLLLNTFDTKDTAQFNAYIALLAPEGTYVQLANPDHRLPSPQINLPPLIMQEADRKSVV